MPFVPDPKYKEWKKCANPEHFPPSHMVFRVPGYWVCPACGHKTPVGIRQSYILMDIPKTTSKEINRILRRANKQGWTFKDGNHIKCYSPDGESIVTVSASPKDRSSSAKVRSDFRRAGLRQFH